MPNTKKISLAWSETGKTVYTIIRREVDLFRINDADGSFTAAPADPYLSLAEDAVIKGLYEVSEARTAWNNGNYFIFIFRQTGANPVPASDMMIGSSLMPIADDEEFYWADIKAKTDTLGGAGAITWNYTLTDSVTAAPIDGAEVWCSTDSAGANIIATGITNAYGIVTFYLDAGTIYVWRKKAGYNFTNPDQETVA